MAGSSFQNRPTAPRARFSLCARNLMRGCHVPDYFADNWIAILALVIAGIALFRDSKTSSDQLELDRRMLEFEQGRDQREKLERSTASVMAELVEDRGTRIRLTNFGISEARALSVLLDDQPYDEHPTFLKGSAKLPDYLAGWSDADIAVSFTLEMRDPVEVDIRWEDDSGTPGHHHMRLGPGQSRTLRVRTELY